MSASLHRIAWCSLSLALLSLGCAEGSGGEPDAGGEEDAGPPPMRDAGMRDAGGTITCPAGQHFCGGGCIDDLANDPANGCRLGCGEPCPTPPDGSPMCNTSGMCGFACELPFRQEGTECVCTPTTCEAAGFDCGAPDDGCLGTLDCGDCGGAGVCNAGRCECAMDPEEPNEGPLAVMSENIVTIPDVNNWVMTFDQWNLHSATDEDWYRFEVTDTGLDNPTIVVTLSGVPLGSDYTLEAYYLCDTGDDLSTCTVASPCSGSPLSMDVDCGNGLSSDDSGALFIHVSSTTWGGACDAYAIEIDSAS